MPPFLHLASAAIAAVLTSGQSEPGWTPLFNGRDLTGWVNVNCAPETFSVKDGMIHTTGAPICALRTARMYENYELEVEYQHLKAGGNAGIFLWSDALPAKGQPLFRTVEVQVLDGDTRPFFTGQGDIFAMHGAVLTPDKPHPEGRMRSNPRERRVKPAGQWNHYRIVANRGAITLAVNGKVVTEATNASPRKGYIALEAEGAPALFRNLRIRELPPDPELDPAKVATVDEGFGSLYTGVDLRGWTMRGADKDKWTAKDWTLVASADAGPLESERLFGDVVVRYDWRIAPGAAPVKHSPWTGDIVTSSEISLTPRLAPAGEWHRTEILVRGTFFSMSFDDGSVSFSGCADCSAPKQGRRLVLRGATAPVEFANIFVKPDTTAGASQPHHD